MGRPAISCWSEVADQYIAKMVLPLSAPITCPNPTAENMEITHPSESKLLSCAR